MFKYRFSLSIGFAGAEQSEVFEYEEEPSEEILEQDWKEWSGNFIDGAYRKLD